MKTGKIEYRKVTPEEKVYVSRVQGVAFSFSPNEKEIREQIEKGESNVDETYAAIDENGRVIAGIEALKYTMWFDGKKTSMYGIGGVAALPEIRRQGNIRKIFEKIYDDIYEQGAVFSHLYPFSHDYYRKFGYEQIGAATKYILPLAPARKFKNNGSVHEFIKGDSARDKLIEIYETYASKYNIMLSRGNDRWDDVFDVSLFSIDRMYYWKDAESNIKAWAKFKRHDGTVEIHDIVWLDDESMFGILQFIGMFEGSADRMAFRAIPEFVAELYWNNLYDIKKEYQWMGMNRIVNVKRALELMNKPEGEGKFTVKVVDDFANWNSNNYTVEYGGGECSVNITDCAADIETSERALVQMVLGVYGLEQIATREDVRVNGNMQELKQVFYKKSLLITDHF